MKFFKSSSLSTGLAMFSMFFGAGNITFPLMIGQSIGQGLIYAIIGLILTGIFIPFSGLFSMILFEGNYRTFFQRIGRIPGMGIILILLAIIGPFGGIPRCITLTYSTLKIYFSSLELISFSVVSAAVIFLLSWRRSRILEIIGYGLAPLLVVTLAVIIFKGLFFSPSPDYANPSQVSLHPFLYGLREGYNTMDLLAAFFFSSLVYHKLKTQVKNDNSKKSLLAPILKASLIGASLLSAIYIGFSYVAANFHTALSGVPIEDLLGRIGHIVLGPEAGLITCLSIALTCLTTAIALTVICAEFIQSTLFKGKLRYESCLGIILALTTCVCFLEFEGIVRMLSPVLEVIYPSLLMLAFFNILHKLYQVHHVKVPVFATSFVAFVIKHFG